MTLAALSLAALRTLLLSAFVQAVVRLMRVRDPQLLLTCWTAVLAASLAMPLLQQASTLRLAVTTALPPSGLFAAGRAVSSAIGPGAAVRTASANTAIDWRQVPTAVYAIVAGGLLIRLLLGLGLSARIWRRGRRLTLEGVDGLSVRISPAVAGPVTLGNTVLLPADCSAWPEDKLRAVIAHEHAHARAGDFYVLVMSQVSRAIFWFSPVSWWLHHRLTLLAEMASDDSAIAELGDRVRYAGVLLDFAGQASPGAVGVAMARPGTVERRIERILTGNRFPPRTGFIERSLAVAGVLCVALIAAVSIAHKSGTHMPLRISRSPSYTPVVLEPGQLDRYAGYYSDLKTGSLMVVTRAGDHLETHRAGLPPVPEYPYSDKDFFLTTVSQQNSFMTDGAGRVTGVVHHQDGRDEVLDRIDDGAGRQQAAEVEKRFADERAAHVQRPIDPSLLETYTGAYALPPNWIATVGRRGNTLFLQFAGRPAHEFLPYGDQDFFSTSAAAQLSFVAAPRGKARAFVLHEGGQDRVATRIGTDAGRPSPSR